jgi:hypothetical protein
LVSRLAFLSVKGWFLEDSSSIILTMVPQHLFTEPQKQNTALRIQAGIHSVISPVSCCSQVAPGTNGFGTFSPQWLDRFTPIQQTWQLLRQVLWFRRPSMLQIVHTVCFWRTCTFNWIGFFVLLLFDQVSFLFLHANTLSNWTVICLTFMNFKWHVWLSLRCVNMEHYFLCFLHSHLLLLGWAIGLCSEGNWNSYQISKEDMRQTSLQCINLKLFQK